MLISEMTCILRSDVNFIGLPANLCKNVAFSAFLPLLSLKMDSGLSEWRCNNRVVFSNTKVNDLRHGKVCGATHFRPRP